MSRFELTSEVVKSEKKFIDTTTEYDPAGVPPKKAEKGGVFRGKNGRVRQRRSVYLPKDTDARLQAYCLEHGRDMSETMGLALELFFAQRGE